MKDIKELKMIGEQMLALSIELLRLIDIDEQERAALIESVKKTLTEKYFIFRAVRGGTNTTTILCKNRQYD